MDVVILNTCMPEGLDDMIEYTLDGSVFFCFYTWNLAKGCSGK